MSSMLLQCKPLAKTLGAALLFAATLGCGSGDDTEPSPDNEQEKASWERKLEEIETGEAAFSLSFVRANAQPMLSGSIFEPATSNACETFMTWASESPPADAWFLRLDIGSTLPGQYDIVGDFDPDETLTAGARLTNITGENDTVDIYAKGGTITVTEAPEDVAGWNEGTQLEAQVHAVFFKTPRRAVSCESTSSTDGEDWSETCTCEDIQGRESTCTRTDPEQECCLGEGADVVFETTVTAIQCPYMCAEPAPGTGSCQDLMPQ